MSKKQHADAVLDGWEGPFFPDILTQLRVSQDENDISTGNLLHESGKRVRGYCKLFRSNTSDGYTWFWGLHFTRRFGQVTVLFPWHLDLHAEDGDKSDRSIAVYTQGSVNSESVIRQLMRAMTEARKAQVNRYK